MNLNNISAHCFFPMDNKIQNYAWGSPSSIRELFGFANDTNQPQAEVWMGTHPNGCSNVNLGQQAVSLSELISKDQSAYLSAETATQFGDLPFLFKILAADSALSIQVHPSKQDAERGFDKEQRAGIPLTDSCRNYKDPNHKPELVYALTDYQAMNGFRSYQEIIDEFTRLNIPELSELLTCFNQQPNSQGLETFFSQLLSMSKQRKDNALDQLLTYASMNANQELYQLVTELAGQYPGDIGLFAPLLLNVITLKPGEAMFLSARTPHAYIKGTGLEIMANSDNVLRAGLTPKHMDIDELIQCTDFVPKPYGSLRLAPTQHGCHHDYAVPVTDFSFSILHQPENEQVVTSSAEILLAIDDNLTLLSANGEILTAVKGQSVFIPAYVGRYTVSSSGRVARAFNQ
ncbi:mannose-6-phosphate isomerase, class I [Vibrio sp. CAU 1672]|uniref:mannose-6-phosphate isomerase, class I n=1 Tax=Vibrio sp. CAU 1672 TaxID=3032594 RepID=UPI0023DAD747|nr:mannose-6-phosphate isomerase, class I [Vibrio sp. CAU 1672]MDF2154527.1 mannose-6-phosphate isomerase, class I [Vibrio sp. CAU 1672]